MIGDPPAPRSFVDEPGFLDDRGWWIDRRLTLARMRALLAEAVSERSPRALADEAGVAATTLGRFLNGHDAVRRATRRRLRRWYLQHAPAGDPDLCLHVLRALSLPLTEAELMDFLPTILARLDRVCRRGHRPTPAWIARVQRELPGRG